MIGKRVQINGETWAALRLLAEDRMATFQELVDEAFSDLFAKHEGATEAKREDATHRGRLPPNHHRR